MKLGHWLEISREILAYPSPRKSVKISSGCGFPAQRSSKKLMLRVRPGVELVFASFAPSRELITLDLPTFDRPRNATSGRVGAGKWLASIADIMNRAKTRMQQCAVSMAKLASGNAEFQRVRILSQPQRMLVLDIFFFDRPELMPQKKHPCHHQPNSYADQEKPAVGGKRDQNNHDYGDGNDQTSRPAEGDFALGWLKIGFHAASPLTL